jgi:demethylmenaquinone methyltransferase/2-methoxy-6-polyprenyl-1,4-benzoquinol methylase
VTEKLVRYYSARAPEYDRIYDKPERQEDLARLGEIVAAWARGHRVLELACGTGHWTAVMAKTARCVVATDVNESVLEIARSRNPGSRHVEFRAADAFRLDTIAGDFTAIFAGFWLSHLERERVPGFLDAVNEPLIPDGSVALLDNRYVEGSSTPISRRDEQGNTYQRRSLDGGEEFEVLKNFFERDELVRLIEPRAATHEIHVLPHYWAVTYEPNRD